MTKIQEVIKMLKEGERDWNAISLKTGASLGTVKVQWYKFKKTIKEEAKE